MSVDAKIGPTPGPWRVEGCRIMAAGEQHVALIDGSGGDDSYVTLTEADYRLIAAAPELLDALKQVEVHLVLLHTLAGRDESRSRPLSIVRLAIAKAEKREGERVGGRRRRSRSSQS